MDLLVDVASSSLTRSSGYTQPDVTNDQLLNDIDFQEYKVNKIIIIALFLRSVIFRVFLSGLSQTVKLLPTKKLTWGGGVLSLKNKTGILN